MSSTAVEFRPTVTRVEVTDSELVVELSDARRISVPLVWFPRLLEGSAEARANWELLGDGEGIHWPDLDEDLSVEGILRGIPARGRR